MARANTDFLRFVAVRRVQLAVAKMVKAGSLLDQGNTDEASSVIGGSAATWSAKLTALAKRKAAGKAEEPAGMMLSSLDVLQTSLQNSDDKKARVAFSATAAALEDFIAAIGMSGDIKGL